MSAVHNSLSMHYLLRDALLSELEADKGGQPAGARLSRAPDIWGQSARRRGHRHAFLSGLRHRTGLALVSVGAWLAGAKVRLDGPLDAGEG